MLMASPPLTHPTVNAESPGTRKRGAAFSHRELTTVLTSTMTTVAPPDTSAHTTAELASCLVTPTARVYGSEGRSAARRQQTGQYGGALDAIDDYIGAAQWHWPTCPGTSHQRSGR